MSLVANSYTRTLRIHFSVANTFFSFVYRTISAMSSNNIRADGVPGFRKFGLAMIQLHPGSDDKTAHLAHTRQMILKAAEGNGNVKPDLITLPVSTLIVFGADL
jgi:hypothetical protein